MPLLEALDLESNCLADEGAGLLAATIPLCPKLHSVCLASNSITDEGGVILASCVTAAPALRSLDISDNELGERCASVLSHILHESSLESVDVSGSCIQAGGLNRPAPFGCRHAVAIICGPSPVYRRPSQATPRISLNMYRDSTATSAFDSEDEVYDDSRHDSTTSNHHIVAYRTAEGLQLQPKRSRAELVDDFDEDPLTAAYGSSDHWRAMLVRDFSSDESGSEFDDGGEGDSEDDDADYEASVEEAYEDPNKEGGGERGRHLSRSSSFIDQTRRNERGESDSEWVPKKRRRVGEDSEEEEGGDEVEEELREEVAMLLDDQHNVPGPQGTRRHLRRQGGGDVNDAGTASSSFV